jgi:dipeptidyl aminopeptidase/acylaminoacyl peptidase
VRLLHGINDTEVPWQTAITLANCLQSNDVLLHFDKAATHRFSEPTQLQSLQKMLEQLLHQLGQKPNN